MAGETERKPEEAMGAAQGMTRREAMLQLLRVGGVAAGAAGGAVWLSEHSFRPVPAKAKQARRDHRAAADLQWPAMTVVQNGEPRALVEKALENLGGISRFVSRQDVVVIKPNIAWDRTPEQAANTNPDVVAEMVRQCGSARHLHQHGREALREAPWPAAQVGSGHDDPCLVQRQRFAHARGPKLGQGSRAVAADGFGRARGRKPEEHERGREPDAGKSHGVPPPSLDRRRITSADDSVSAV